MYIYTCIYIYRHTYLYLLSSLKDLSQPVSVNGIHRPISMYARLAAYNGDVRYMVNILLYMYSTLAACNSDIRYN